MVEVRKTTDLKEIMEWRKIAMEEIYSKMADREILKADKEYYTEMIESGGQSTYIASLNGEDLGSGTICYMKELPSPENVSGKMALVGYVFVKPGYRARGIGEAIIERMVMEARMKGCGKIWIDGLLTGRGQKDFMGFQSRPGIYEIP